MRPYYQFYVAIVFIVLYLENASSSDPKLIEVEGPGLTPDTIVMPARYFFIYGYGKHYSGGSSISEKDYNIQIKGQTENKRDCRIWLNVLNRKDGSLIVRYRMFDTCYNLKIIVQYRGTYIKGFPIEIKGPVYDEDCYCPEQDFSNWYSEYGCEDSYDQIRSDLKRFQSVNFSSFYDSLANKFRDSHAASVCNYIVKNNEVFRNCFGKHQGFKIFLDAMFLSLVRKVKLPDFELMANLGDWPLMGGDDPPVFSWCGSKPTTDIVMPTYDLMESTLQAMSRVSLDMLSVQGNIEKTWSHKEERLFWRGRDSSPERLKLINISRLYPDLFNVSLTNFFFYRDEKHLQQYGPKAKHVSFFKFFNYKYQINLDGTVAAYRMPYLLAGDSLVFKQESPYYEHWYGMLTPWVHYVPVKRDLSDLVERILWAKEHDKEARSIARAGSALARTTLLPQQVICYHANLFNEWSKRLISPVKVRKGMEKVPQPEMQCSCKRLKNGLRSAKEDL